MEQKILIAEPRKVIRLGFRTMLEQDGHIKSISEASTIEQIREQLHNTSFNLIIIHQSLVREFKLLPMDKFILLVDEPDISIFMEAYAQKVRAYISTHISSELLLAAIHIEKGTCFLDPIFVPWLMDTIFKYMQDLHELNNLSCREREIVHLIKSGLDRKMVAQQLHITGATLKTHIKNIARKQEKIQQRSVSSS